MAVVAVWGTNFVVIKVALATLPPLLLGVLRFSLALFPAVLFVPRPAVRWRPLALYGVLIGAGQFGLLYLAMDGRITPGLASLVIQMQVFFTIGLAMLGNGRRGGTHGTRGTGGTGGGERLRAVQWLALLLAAGGILLIALHAQDRTDGHAGGETTVAGLLLVLTAAAAWGCGNQVARQMGRVQMLGVVVWSSAFALPPLLALSLWFEGPARMAHGLASAGPGTWAAVAWQAVGNTLFGYAAWGWLLARHPAALVSPMALLVPVFGMAAAAWMLGEALPAWKLGAAALVLAGLALNMWWPRKA